jgi:hypothetical protein
MAVIEDRQLSAFVTAFEQAWDEFAASGAPVSADMLRFREILARKILALAGDREGDGVVLSGRYRPSVGKSTEGRVVNALA